MSNISIIESFKKFNKKINVYGTYEKPLFLAKEIGEILEIPNIRSSIRYYPHEWISRHVRNSHVAKEARMMTFLNEPALYKLILKSNKLEALKFQRWVCEDILPSIRKNGEYKIIHKINKNLTFTIMNEFDLHTKTVNFIKKRFKNSLFTCTLGELQDTSEKRIKSWKQGYIKGSPDLIIYNKHIKYSGFVIEFKTPNGKGVVSDSQLKILKNFKINNFKILLSNDYDEIIENIINYFKNERINCEYCSKKFKTHLTLNNHNKFFHKINNIL